MNDTRLPISDDALRGFCRRWNIKELALFGSAARGDLRLDSDIEVLVTFAHDAEWSTFDIIHAKREFESLLRRRVSLVERPALLDHHNPWLRHAILSEARTLYQAA